MAASDVTTKSRDDEVMAEAALWREQGRQVALATVVQTWGSSPRPMGSQLAVDSSGTFVGSVSGGCIEGAVVHEALEVIKDGTPRLLEYGVTNEMAWEVGLACGGKINIFVERVELKSNCSIVCSRTRRPSARWRWQPISPPANRPWFIPPIPMASLPPTMQCWRRRARPSATTKAAPGP